MRTKIVYCLPSLHWGGGVERVTSLKAIYFAEKLGYDVYIVLTEGEKTEPFYPLSPKITLINLEINYDELYGKSFLKRVFSYFYKQTLFKRRLTNCLVRIKPDITISTLRREINFINSIKDGSRKVGELHVSRNNYRDFQYERVPNFIKKIIGRLWIKQLISKIKQLDRFVVLTYKDKEKWKEIEESHVEVIYNPLPFYPSEAGALDNKKVIAVGRYSFEKGFDLLIKTWKMVSIRHPDWQLHVYGEGERRAYLEQVKELNLQDTCFLHPAYSSIQDKYVESSVFVLSSRFEGFGMALIESMACGVPPVSFACPTGPQEIINDGVDGLLVERENISILAEKISYLIENEEIRKQLGENARKSAKRFKIDVIANQWINLFEELLENEISVN